jgi:hypothetical protein
MPLAKQRSTVNWYVRRAVPRDLVAMVGKREVWRSLKTPDKTIALKRSRKVEAEIDPTLFAGPAANDWRAGNFAVESRR